MQLIIDMLRDFHKRADKKARQQERARIQDERSRIQQCARCSEVRTHEESAPQPQTRLLIGASSNQLQREASTARLQLEDVPSRRRQRDERSPSPQPAGAQQITTEQNNEKLARPTEHDATFSETSSDEGETTEDETSQDESHPVSLLQEQSQTKGPTTEQDKPAQGKPESLDQKPKPQPRPPEDTTAEVTASSDTTPAA